MKTEIEIKEISYKRYGTDPHSFGGQRDGFIEGYKMCQEYADQFNPKWISVDDRFPENHTSILLVGQSIRSTGIFIDGIFHSDFKLPEHKDITHWMPLPTPPEQ